MSTRSPHDEDDNGLLLEAIDAAIEKLERRGLIEWTGEMRPGRDGKPDKVWRVVARHCNG